MLDKVLAQNFIEKITKFTDYNVNIMDDRGIIIASKTEKRIGTFHEIAFQIIQENKDVIVVEENKQYIGVKEGVNMAIFYNDKKVGVVGITGKPTEVSPVALMLKMSVETMLEYEIYKTEKNRRRNLKEQLLNLILYGENIEDRELQRYAGKLDLEEALIRIPILIHLEEESEQVAEKALADIRNHYMYSKQDLICLTRNNSIIIYKHLSGSLSELMKDYKYIIGEFMSPILRYFKSEEMAYRLYIGSFQNKFVNYRAGYKHCKWLSDNVEKCGSSLFFYDHIDRYFRSLIPLTELHDIYHIFKDQLDKKFIDNYIEILEALAATDYNLNEASKKMHIHKNTLVYRLDKLRETLDMNPLSPNNEREFMDHMCFYFTQTRIL